MNTPFIEHKLSKFQEIDGATSLENEFVIIDNFSWGETDQTIETIFANHLIKLTFNLALVCRKGCIRVKANTHYYEIRANDAIVMFEGMFGEYLGMDEGTEIMVLLFTTTFLNNSAYRADDEMSILKLLYASPFHHLSAELMEDTVELLLKMKSVVGKPSYVFKKTVVISYLQIFTCNFYNYLITPARSAGMGISTSKSRNKLIYDKFIEDVQNNYTRQRNLSYYAERQCVSPRYLSKAVLEASGRQATDWISDYVIMEAKALLFTGKYSVGQIAETLNFADQSFFGKYFKRKVGVSPAAICRHSEEPAGDEKSCLTIDSSLRSE